MDEKPFMEINLLDIDEQLVPELKKLTKSSFELDKMLTTASELKYIRAIKHILSDELDEPSTDFIRFLVGQVYSGLKTQQVLEQFTPIVKNAFKQFINGQISDRLKSALNDNNEIEEESEKAKKQTTGKNGIVTTQEELDGFYIVRAILHEVMDVTRIDHRDTKSYFGILLDDNNRKPVCRLHFNTAQKYIGIFDEHKKEVKTPIDSLSDIYKFSEQLKETVKKYE